MRDRRGVFAAAGAAAAAALSVSLGGCGGAAGPAASAAPAARADAAIEMITAAQDRFYLTMECGAAVEARRLGVHLTVAGPARNAAADQLPLVQGVIVGNPDALIISPAADATSSSLTAAGPGAVAALGAAHETGKVKLATFDASPFQMTGLGAGTIQLTVAQEPGVEGADAVDQAVNAIAGKQVVPAMSTPMVAITPQNMNEPAVKRFIYDGTCTASLRGRMAAADD